MKAKVVIENGRTSIVLTPENSFETDIMDKLHTKRKSYKILTEVEAEYSFGVYQKHRIELLITETKYPQTR